MRKDGLVATDMNQHLQQGQGHAEDPQPMYYQSWFRLWKDVLDPELPVKIIDYHKHY